jgi:hypothetical protein
MKSQLSLVSFIKKEWMIDHQVKGKMFDYWSLRQDGDKSFCDTLVREFDSTSHALTMFICI